MIRANRWQGIGLLCLIVVFCLSVQAGGGQTTAESAITRVNEETWLERNATVPNLIVVATFLVHLGMYRQQFNSILKRVDALDEWVAKYPERLRIEQEHLIRREEFTATITAQNSILTTIQSSVNSVVRRVDDAISKGK